jgi:hypothetical protein
MSGGGGFDPGKDLANLDKDLGLSKNAPLIAAATAMYFSGGALGGETVAAELAGGVGAAGAGAAEAAGLSALDAGAGVYGTGAETAFSAAAPAAQAATPAAAASVVPTAVAPVATEVAGAAAPVAPVAGPYTAQGGASLADMYGGPAAAPAASPGLPGLFDQAATAYGNLNPVLKYGIPLAAAAMLADRNKGGTPEQKPYDGPLSRLKYDPDRYRPLEVKPPTPYTPVYKDYRNMADGGFLGAVGKGFGADLERLLNRQQQDKYATPPLNYDPARYDPEVGTKMVARPGMAGGGLADLGDYADYAGGGRMLKGPGDGMSDSIPAVIAGKQPARLANDEFVVPADVVSHLGNGSSDAGAKQLYKMMDKVRAARTGKQAQAKQINPNKYMPA